jgi:hypothetical protein
LQQRTSVAGIAWAGYAFENTCLTHVAQIKKALGISGILTEQSAWQHRASARDKSGTQIDLLIDRPDGVINLCNAMKGHIDARDNVFLALMSAYIGNRTHLRRYSSL